MMLWLLVICLDFCADWWIESLLMFISRILFKCYDDVVFFFWSPLKILFNLLVNLNMWCIHLCNNFQWSHLAFHLKFQGYRNAFTWLIQDWCHSFGKWRQCYDLKLLGHMNTNTITCRCIFLWMNILLQDKRDIIVIMTNVLPTNSFLLSYIHIHLLAHTCTYACTCVLSLDAPSSTRKLIFTVI